MSYMSDLISRKVTMESLREYAEAKFANGEIELANGILKAAIYIETGNLPTAYDVDKVVKQLKNGYDIVNWGEPYGITLEKAERIVKGGGVNE